MQVIIEDHSLEHMNYPVGEEIQFNLPIIKKMGRLLIKYLKENQPPTRPVNLVCSGSSGAIVAGIIISMIKNPYSTIIHVKKKGEHSHHTTRGNVLNEYYAPLNIFVDDFISSGQTLEYTIRTFGYPIHGVVVSAGLNYAINPNWEVVICRKVQ